MNKILKTDINVFKKNITPGERTQQIISDADIRSNYLPKTVTIEDIDFEIDRQFKEDNFALILQDEVPDRQLVPSIFLSNERWGEFSKTWKLVDQDKNISPPYITIKKVPNFKQGTYSGEKFNIPNKRSFTYITVPYFENGGFGYEVYSIPQPTAIDLTYEIRLFTKFTEDVNAFVQMFMKNFNSLQYYIKVNGQFFRVTMEETFDNEDSVEIEKDKYHVSIQTISVKGYLQDEKDFKMVKSYNRVGLNIKTDDGTSLGQINT